MHNNINVNVGGPVQASSTYKTVVLKGNIPFAEQIGDPNVKYVIKWDFDLGGESVTIPENCILEFDGGSLRNGSVVSNNTYICGRKCIEESVILEGFDIIKVSWFKTDDYSACLNNYSDKVIVLDVDIDITQTLYIANRIMSNNSSVIKRIGDVKFDMIVIRDADDVTVDGIVVDGNRGSEIAHDDNNFCGIKVLDSAYVTIKNCKIISTLNNEHAAGIWLESATSVIIQDCHFYNIYATALFMYGTSSKIMVSNCVFKDNFGSAIQTGSATDVTIANNYCENNGYSSISVNGSNTTVIGNIVRESGYAGINIGHATTPGLENVSVTGNNVVDAILGCIYISTVKNIVVSDNVLVNNEVGDNCLGIDIRDSPTDITISDNIIIQKNSLSCIRCRIATNLVRILRNTFKFLQLGVDLHNADIAKAIVVGNSFGAINNSASDRVGIECWCNTYFANNVFFDTLTVGIVQTRRKGDIENNIFNVTSQAITTNSTLGGDYFARYNTYNTVTNRDSIMYDDKNISLVGNGNPSVSRNGTIFFDGTQICVWNRGKKNAIGLRPMALGYSQSELNGVPPGSLEYGRMFANSTHKIIVWCDQTAYINAFGFTSAPIKGLSTERPKGIGATNGVLNPTRDIGYMFFDMTLMKPIYASAIANDGIVTWVDATGATV